MAKSKNDNRRELVELAMKSTALAAKQLRAMADGLEQCKNTSDIVFALSEIYGVSERTIFRDLS